MSHWCPVSAKCVVVGVLLSQVSAAGGRDQERPGAGSVFGLYTAAVRRGGRKTIKPKGLKLCKDWRVGRVGLCLELYSMSSSLPHLNLTACTDYQMCDCLMQFKLYDLLYDLHREGTEEYPLTLLLQLTVIVL